MRRWCGLVVGLAAIAGTASAQVVEPEGQSAGAAPVEAAQAPQQPVGATAAARPTRTGAAVAPGGATQSDALVRDAAVQVTRTDPDDPGLAAAPDEGTTEQMHPSGLAVPVPRVRPADFRPPAAPDGPVPLPPMSPMNPAHPMDRALVCMARNLYHEARGQSRKGQIAVGHVVMNRVRHRRYPNTVCGVIKQGGLKGPCQFSWYCDRRSNKPRDMKSYSRLLDLSLQILSGEVADPTNGANMFHSTAVRPRWARVAQSRGRIGAHLFYYLRGR